MAQNLEDLVKNLQSALVNEKKLLEEKEESIRQQEAYLAAGYHALESKRVNDSDIIHLNVGGTVFSTRRETLCLVPDSLLSLMFSGRWQDAHAHDDKGRAFLDLNPDLFSRVLNWLRTFVMCPLQAVVPEPQLPRGSEEEFMVMLDYLQLHKHIPLTFPETFSPARCSRTVRVLGPSATRLPNGPSSQHGIRPSQEPSFPPHAQHKFMAVASSSHSYYDLLVELELEVVHFGVDVGDCAAGPMVVGFMSKALLEELPLQDPGKPNTKPTHQRTFHGFYTGKAPPKSSSDGNEDRRRHASASKTVAFALRDGEKGEELASGRLLWHQGDTLRVTLDCRHHLPWPRITLFNTVNQAEYSCEAKPRRAGARGARARRGQEAEASTAAGSSSSNAGGRGEGAQQQQQQEAGGPAGTDGQRRASAAAAGLANGHLGRGEAAGQSRQGPAAAAGGGGELENGHTGAAPSRDRQGQAQASGAAGTASSSSSNNNSSREQQQQHPPGENNSSSMAADSNVGTGGGEVASGAAADYGSVGGESSWLEWVLVVGMTAPGDQVRLLSARRLGTNPHMREW